MPSLPPLLQERESSCRYFDLRKGRNKIPTSKISLRKEKPYPPKKASEPEIRGKTQPAPGDGELLLMDGKNRAKPNLAGARWGGEAAQRRAPGCARACHCPDGDTPVEQGDLDEAPQKGKKQQNLLKDNSSPSLSPCRGDDSGERSTGSPRQAPSPFNLHPSPPGITLLFLITLPFLARTSDSNSCGPGAAGRGDGEGPTHARTETQLKKVEYGLTKNKRQVSCLPLGYARWRRGTQGWWHPGRSPQFFLPPTPAKTPQNSAQD